MITTGIMVGQHLRYFNLTLDAILFLLHRILFLFIFIYQLPLTMFEFLLILCAVYYFVMITALAFGIRPGIPRQTDHHPSVSVIVAARNEEQNIGECIESLLKCDYPSDKYEIVLVNDSSHDTTGIIMQNYARMNSMIQYIEVDPVSVHIRGKANALAQGIASSHGELIFFTDADCTVPPSWVKSQAAYFKNQTGLVGGFTRLRSNNWFSGMQALDWFFLYSVGAGAVGLGKPLTAVGNNFCVRRDAYNDVGGFEKLPFSVTEDYILFNAIKESQNWKIRFPLDPGTLVTSRPCVSFRDLYRQKHRWATGAADIRAETFIYFTPIYLFHLIIPLFPVFGIPFQTAFAAMLIKVTADALILSKPLLKFRSLSLYRYFLQFQVLAFTYILMLPFQIIFKRKVIWKDRSYGKK
jgi:cellulose synthase/poly-beta-1,6-N-acetylglucosamine synthase-like glycosyltransferase